jgi:addiction module HigA family antidote
MVPKLRPPTHPGEMLREEFLIPLELSQAEAARRLKMPLNRLNGLIKGKRGVTPDTALRLSELLKTSAEFWLNLQGAWDLWHALERRKARGEVGSIRPLRTRIHARDVRF